MVRDANGQYSVSYVDMHGRTIATALAGNSPSVLQALSSFRDSIQVDPVINSTNITIKGNSIESVKGLVVTLGGNHSFHYQINPQSLQLPDSLGTQVCYDCLYNLTITITDDCGNQNLPGGQPYVVQLNNFTLGQFDTSCANPARGFDTSFLVYLPEGSYTITKQLRINEEGMNCTGTAFI